MPDFVRWRAEGNIEAEDEGGRRWIVATAGRWRAFASTGELALLLRDGAPAGPPSPGSARAVLAGDLGAMPPPDVAAVIYGGKRSGTLFTLSEGRQRHLVFREGNLAWAASGTPGERLGEVAVRQGLLTPAQLREVTADAASSRRIGQRLVDLGLLTAEQLFHAIQAQVTEIFCAWLVCTTGAFVLTDDPGEAGKASKVNLDTQQLILEGVQRIDEMAHFRERLPTPLVVVSRTARTPAGELEPAERRALELVDGRLSLAEIQAALGCSEYDATRAVHRLVERGLAAVGAGVQPPPSAEELVVIEEVSELDAAERAAQINEALRDIFAGIERTSDPGHYRLSLDSFLASESKRRTALKGLYVRPDGSIDDRLFLANLEIQGASVADLEEVVAFALFEAGERLDPQREAEVARAVGQRLARIR